MSGASETNSCVGCVPFGVGAAFDLLLFAVGMAVVLSGCSVADRMSGGEVDSELSRSSRERMVEERRRAVYESAKRAGIAADGHPDDLRAQRKAAELAVTALRVAAAERAQAGEASYDDAKIVGWVEGALERLRTWKEGACRVRLEAGRVYEIAEKHEEASRVYVESVEECRSPAAAIRATRPLRLAGRCDRALELIEAVWPPDDKEREVSLLDAVHRCSSEVSLRENLSFVPETVVEDYYDLLEEREERARERRGRTERRRRERERERRRLRSERKCQQHCRSSYSSCRSSCSSGATECRDRCRARRESCFAQCY